MHQKMLRVLAALVVMVLVVGASPGDPERDSAETVTLRGEIVEAGCYLERGQRAADNPTCIKRCAASGMPMALVTGDETVYLILRSHTNSQAYEQAKNLAAEKVELSGVVHERGGLKGILVTSVRVLDTPAAPM